MGIQGVALSKQYRKKQVLQQVSVQLAQGECLGILGDNGSGKSTLLSIIAGMQQPSTGTVLCDDMPMTKQLRQRIGYVPQVPILLEELTVKQNLSLWQSIYGLSSFAAAMANIPACLAIEALLPKRVASLSGGMKKKVSIAIALMHAPSYLILDEAFAALDAKTAQGMLAFLKTQPQMGVLYSSHHMQEIASLCHRVVVLRQGSVVYQSPTIAAYDAQTLETLYQYF